MSPRRDTLLPLLFPLALLTAPAPSGAQATGSTVSNAPAAHERLVAVFQEQPMATLEQVYLRCARESEQRVFGGDEAGFCSIAFEVLMKRRFGGDFEAMLAWWRTHRLR